MKKKILPDGSVELEGDPDELHEYEKGQGDDRQVENTKKGKRLLNEEKLVELIEEAVSKFRPYVERPYWFEPPWYDRYPHVQPQHPGWPGDTIITYGNSDHTVIGDISGNAKTEWSS